MNLLPLRAIALCFLTSVQAQSLFAQTTSAQKIATFDSLFNQAFSFAEACNLMNWNNCEQALSNALLSLRTSDSFPALFAPRKVISLYAFIGDIYHRGRKFPEAVQYLDRGVAFADSTVGRNCREVADCFYFRGLVEEYRLSFKQALQYHQECLSIRQQLNDAAGLAKSHQRIGACYGNMKDREREKQHLEFAKAICEQNPEIEPEISYNIALDLAGCAANTGEFEEAIAFVERLLADPELTDKQKLNALSRLSHIHNTRGEFARASESYQRFVEIAEKSEGPHYIGLAMIYSDWGRAKENLGDVKGALACYQKVIEITGYKYPYKHYGIGAATYRIASLYFQQQDYVTALQYLQQALIALSPGFEDTNYTENPGLEISTSYDFLRRTLWLKTRVLLILSQQPGKRDQYFTAALRTCELSLDLIEKLRNDLPTTGARSGEQANVYNIYEEAIFIALEDFNLGNSNAAETAFTINEKSKSFLLFSGIRENQAIQFSQIPESLRKTESILRQQIAQLETRRNFEAGKGKHGSDSIMMQLTGKLFELRREYELLVKTFETGYPDYYRLKYDFSTVSVGYVQNTLLQPDQTLLEYFSGDSSIFLFVVQPHRYEVLEVKRNFPLDDWVKKLQHGLFGYYAADKIQQTDTLRRVALNDYLDAADSLYQKLLAPVAGLLTGSLVIVPDGVLGYVPFEALLEKRPAEKDKFLYQKYPFFGKKHVVSYCYSATLLKEMRDKQHRQSPELEFLGFAPYFTGDTSLLSRLYAGEPATRKDLAPLLHSGEEVAAVAGLMNGKAYFGKDATEARFTAEAGKARILHLATHGRADNRAGDYAWLAFSEIKDSVENELLYVRDLYNLALNADLVVLSACETAIGKLQRGEGIISLARAFAYAGAKSIVTTLWSVNDRRTKDLMILFYQNMKKGMPKDRALWQAKQDFIRAAEGEGAHPYFWSAFIGIGL